MPNLVVFKLGGSLLDLPDLPDRVRWATRQRPDRALIVVGGGPAVDVVRDQDRRHELGDERSHWLAVEAMESNSRSLATRLPEAVLVANHQQLRASVAILLPTSFLRRHETESNAEVLPHSWDVTSDSIAAWVARFAGASELVLLKSTSLSERSTFEDAAAAKLLDAHFPRAAKHLPRVSWCNLREPEPRIVAWRSNSDAVPA
jgi:aspartokinase-like uncharacterized kinase